MVQGVDLWLNNPRRGEEACGTSGMKAGINGVLNLSILDGWFDEGLRDFRAAGPSATANPIPRTRTKSTPARSTRHLENEIVPMYYQDRDEGVPARLGSAGEAVADASQSLSSIASAWLVSICRSCMNRRIRRIWIFRTIVFSRPSSGRVGTRRSHEVWDKVGFRRDRSGPGCFGPDGRSHSPARRRGFGWPFARGCACGSGGRPHRRERKSGRNSGDEPSGGGTERYWLCVPKGVCAASDRSAGLFASNQPQPL